VQLTPFSVDACNSAAFFLTDPATTVIYTLSLHDALPIYARPRDAGHRRRGAAGRPRRGDGRRRQRGDGGDRRRLPGGRPLRSPRSEEHTSELQSPCNLVCRLLLEKKNLTPQATGASCRYRRIVSVDAWPAH